MKKAFDGADRFFPITYQKDWEIVRSVAAAGGESFGKQNYEQEQAREAASKAKK
jgi:phosphonate transport system substrate-binding protein